MDLGLFIKGHRLNSKLQTYVLSNIEINLKALSKTNDVNF